MFFRFALSLAALLAIPCLVKQADAAAPLDLKTAVDQALANSPAIREAEEKLNQLRFQKYGIRSSLLPQIAMSANAAHRKDSVANKTVGAVPFGGSPYNLYNVGIKGEQVLLAYGTFSAVAMAEYDRELGANSVEIARRDLTRRLISVYYRTVMNENLLRLLDEQEKVVGEILSIAQRRVNLGGKRIDVLQVRTQLALLKPKIEKAKNELSAAAAELANLMGKADTSEITIRGRMPNISTKELEKFLNLKEFNLPELNAIRLQRAQVDEEKSVTLGKNLPNLKILGDFNFINYTKADLFEPASNAWSVQLLLTVPIFSGLSSVFERRALNSRDAQLEYQERDVTNAVVLEQIKSRKGLESAEASLASAEEAAKLARDSLNEARRDYRFGIMDFLQFLQVEAQDFEAATSLLQLRYDAINASSTYFAASGQPLSTLVEILSREEKKP